jgi:hypothetical protein
MDETWILIDGNTGLHVGWYFWLRVLDEVNRSDRYGSPFGVLLLEAVRGKTRRRQAIDEALACVPPVVRSTDLAGAVGAGRAGVLLTEQPPDGATVAKGRIIERLAASTPAGVAWRSRLLCYPRDAAEISELLISGRNGGSHDEIWRVA